MLRGLLLILLGKPKKLLGSGHGARVLERVIWAAERHRALLGLRSGSRAALISLHTLHAAAAGTLATEILLLTGSPDESQHDTLISVSDGPACRKPGHGINTYCV